LDIWCDGLLYNISKEGISFVISKPLDFDFVELSFVHASDRASEIEINGRLVYCNQIPSGRYLMGIKLLGSRNENSAFKKRILDHCVEGQNILNINLVGFLSQ
jgi:hypothetical protein